MDPASYYTVFIRVFVTEDTYASTGWYPVVLTLQDDVDTVRDKMSRWK